MDRTGKCSKRQLKPLVIITGGGPLCTLITYYPCSTLEMEVYVWVGLGTSLMICNFSSSPLLSLSSTGKTNGSHLHSIIPIITITIPITIIITIITIITILFIIYHCTSRLIIISDALIVIKSIAFIG
jgi:hypothetical protein